MTQMKTTGKKVSIIRNRKRQSEEPMANPKVGVLPRNFLMPFEMILIFI